MEFNSLDRLATGGIINFDADAYVKGTPPRYVGNPSEEVYPPGEAPLTGAPMAYGYGMSSYGMGGYTNLYSGSSRALAQDAFISREKEGHENSHLPLKGIITAGLVAALALFTGSKIKNIFKSKKDIKAKAKSKAEKPEGKIKSFISDMKNKVTSWFKSDDKISKVKESAKKVKKEVEDTAKKAAKDKKGFFSKIFKSKAAKITGISAIALLGLYGLFSFLPKHKVTTQHKNNPEPQKR